MKVYGAINAITAALSKEGISKDRKNQQQGYSFRGIDDVLNALAVLLAEHHVVILPEVLEREQIERQTRQGGALFYVTVKVRYAIVHAEDGSRHDVVLYGEAMDSADKATNKAMSASYKYMAIQTFCIPTVGDNDADATTHDVAPRAGQVNLVKLKQSLSAPGASPSPGVEAASVGDPGSSRQSSAGPSYPADDPTAKYRRTLGVTDMTNAAINAWWATVPEELRQDLTGDFRQALQDVAKLAKKK